MRRISCGKLTEDLSMFSFEPLFSVCSVFVKIKTFEDPGDHRFLSICLIMFIVIACINHLPNFDSFRLCSHYRHPCIVFSLFLDLFHSSHGYWGTSAAAPWISVRPAVVPDATWWWAKSCVSAVTRVVWDAIAATIPHPLSPWWIPEFIVWAGKSWWDFEKSSFVKQLPHY